MTKKQALQVRADTYKPPDNMPRCETCEHYCGRWYSEKTLGSCHAIEIRGHRYPLAVHPLGVCDLWKEKVKQ